MISEVKKAQPFIDFGFGIITQQVTIGQPAMVWLSTIFNMDEYSISLVSGGATVLSTSPYQYTVAYDEPGAYDIIVYVISKKKDIVLSSNILNITVI